MLPKVLLAVKIFFVVPLGSISLMSLQPTL
jgi:hypothetical protein